MAPFAEKIQIQIQYTTEMQNTKDLFSPKRKKFTNTFIHGILHSYLKRGRTCGPGEKGKEDNILFYKTRYGKRSQAAVHSNFRGLSPNKSSGFRHHQAQIAILAQVQNIGAFRFNIHEDEEGMAQ